MASQLCLLHEIRNHRNNKKRKENNLMSIRSLSPKCSQASMKEVWVWVPAGKDLCEPGVKKRRSYGR